MSTLATCHCGAVRLTCEAAPVEVTDCNCSICRRYGVLWAYYEPGQVRIEGGPTQVYMWDDRSIGFHRCAACGCVTHWSAADPARNRMGVNARMMDLEVVARARLRRLDGAISERYLD